MESPSFRKLLEQFEGDYTFTKLVKSYELGPDELAYEIETNQGRCLVFEQDFISGLEIVKEEIKRVGTFKELISVKKSVVFKESEPFRATSVYQKPSNWSEVRR